MKFFLTFLFTAIYTFGIAQNEFLKCKLFFENGNKVEGYARLPTNISMDDKIKYKKNARDKDIVKIDGERLKEIIYFNRKNKPMFFVNTKFYRSTINSRSKVETKLFRKYWMIRDLTNDKLFAYVLAEAFRITKDGGLSIYSMSQLGLGDYSVIYLIKKPEEEYPSMINFRANGYVSKGDKFFRRMAKAYFKNDKPIYKRIQKGEFSRDNFDELISAYCNCDYKDTFYIHY